MKLVAPFPKKPVKPFRCITCLVGNGLTRIARLWRKYFGGRFVLVNTWLIQFDTELNTNPKQE